MPSLQGSLVSFSADTPGLVAAVLEDLDASVWTICVSRDLGERWEVRDRLQGEKVNSATWLSRDGRPQLILGTQQALRRLHRDGTEGSVIVDRLMQGPDAKEKAGVIALASMRHPSGASFLAVRADGPGRRADLRRRQPARQLPAPAGHGGQGHPRAGLPARR
ncbi:hypothetical protein [Dankookia sp. P2]|uniref:hypothetical protein n=1 Tax=Dankookia sp. P2 TaxID=3423955 RepID=UPI003D669EF5